MMKEIELIIAWLQKECPSRIAKGLIVGISGGIDSAVTSTLCAMTGLPVHVMTMPIGRGLHLPAKRQIKWLKEKFPNVTSESIDLTKIYTEVEKVVPYELSRINSKARLRMLMLYARATEKSFLVVGTGNKVEDFGIGFFTKYGDGGVDISPIADLTKTQVYDIAKELEILQEIQDAPPTDGLWNDGRNDEDQIGATYKELEWAMEYHGEYTLNKRQQEVWDIYTKLRNQNYHKMVEIPVCRMVE